MNAAISPASLMNAVSAAVQEDYEHAWPFSEARSELTSVYRAALCEPQVLEHRDGTSVTMMNTEAVKTLVGASSVPTQYEMMMMIGAELELPQPSAPADPAPIFSIQID